MKNALNGVAVNLEVVRSRAQRAEPTTASVTRFADSAADQLDRLTILSEALLALARPPREPVDVRATAMALHALLSEGHTGGAGLVNGTLYEGPAITSVPGEAVRLALARALLPAADDEPPAEWCIEPADGGARAALAFRLRRPSVDAPALDAGVESAVRAAGVLVERETQILNLFFPARAP